jgi:hypothetical protein
MGERYLKSKKPHQAFLHSGKDFLVLNTKDSLGYPTEEIGESFDWVSAYKCTNCGSVFLFSGTAELSEIDNERQMGPEKYYSDTEFFNCSKCNQKISIDVFFNEYATCWIFVEEISGVEGENIEGLEDLLEEYYKFKLASKEKGKLENRKKELENTVNNLLELIESHELRNRIYVLIVEGDDDRAIWEQFLRREEVPLECIDIVRLGKGGKSEAIKLAETFRANKLRLIPHKLVIDSDNNLEGILQELKAANLNPDSYHVLKEKEIESYLLEAEAIAKVINEKPEAIRIFLTRLKGGSGKETLDKVFLEYVGHKPDSLAKGLIAKALKKTPYEFKSIIEELEQVLSRNKDKINRINEDQEENY